MYDKKADNRIIDNKKKIIQLDNKIEDKKSAIKEIKNVEEGIDALRKSINRCIELLDYSIKGSDAKKILDISSDVNISNSKRIIDKLDYQKNKLKKDVKTLDKERELLESQKKG